MWLENILAHAHLGRGCTQIKYSSQRMAQQIVNQIERHKFCLNDWFTKSSRTEIQTCKVQERTFGRPCIAEKRKTQTTLLSKNPKLTNRLSIRLCFSHSTCYISQLKYRPTSVGRMVGLSSSHKYSTGQARSGVQAIVSARSYFLLSLKELVRFFLTRSVDITRDYFSFSTSNILIFYIILTR